MTVSATAWAMRQAPHPQLEMHNGHGSIYLPIAKLVLLRLSDAASEDGDGFEGTVTDFARLCEEIWLTPDMGTRVLEKLAEEKIVELYILEREEAPAPQDRFHGGVLISFGFRMGGRA